MFKRKSDNYSLFIESPFKSATKEEKGLTKREYNSRKDYELNRLNNELNQLQNELELYRGYQDNEAYKRIAENIEYKKKKILSFNKKKLNIIQNIIKYLFKL